MTQPIASYEVSTHDTDQTRAFGRDLNRILAAEDLLMLSGDLGVDKTASAQGTGTGTGVYRYVASPTLIVARVHPSLSGGLNLIHVDAYHITDLNDLGTFDLDSSLDEAITVVEWGEGKIEAMSDECLSIEVRWASGGEAAHDGDVIDLENMGNGMHVIVLYAHGCRQDGVFDGVVAIHGGIRIDRADTGEQDHTMREIALDTQAATAVAIINDGCVLGHTRDNSEHRRAGSTTPLVREALTVADLPAQLANADIDRVLVGTDPTPSAGLRAGLVSVRVPVSVAGVPAYGISALDVVARRGLDRPPPDTRVYAIADARRREPYWGSYVTAGPDDVTLEGHLEMGGVSALLSVMRTAPGFVVAGAPIPAHSADMFMHTDLGPQMNLDPAVMSRIIAMHLLRSEDDRLRTDLLCLRRLDTQGQPTARL